MRRVLTIVLALAAVGPLGGAAIARGRSERTVPRCTDRSGCPVGHRHRPSHARRRRPSSNPRSRSARVPTPVPRSAPAPTLGAGTPAALAPPAVSAPAAGAAQSGTPSVPASLTATAPPLLTPVTPAPSRLQVTAREFSLTLSHPAITGGAAIIEFVDRGQDPHDLHIRAADAGADVGAFAEAVPGAHSDGSFTLAPGTYTLYCALPGHEDLGMQATLTVNPS